MRVNLKSLLGSVYVFDIEKEKTINDLINIFYEKHKKKITKIIYKGKLLEKNKTIEECNYTHSDGLMIILFNKKITDNSKKKELKVEDVKDVELNLNNYKESIIKYEKHKSNKETKNIYSISEDQLKDSKFLIDLLSEVKELDTNYKMNINDYLEIFTNFNENDYKEMNEILQNSSSDEEEIGFLYLYCNKNKELVYKILNNN